MSEQGCMRSPLRRFQYAAPGNWVKALLSPAGLWNDKFMCPMRSVSSTPDCSKDSSLFACPSTWTHPCKLSPEVCPQLLSENHPMWPLLRPRTKDWMFAPCPPGTISGAPETLLSVLLKLQPTQILTRSQRNSQGLKA